MLQHGNEPEDIQFGSSELELYPFCKDCGITLYVSEHMHLKLYSVGLNSAILATGNVSNRGLMPDGNYEAATLIEQLNSKDRLFFEGIRGGARLVNDIMYEELKKWKEENKVDLPKQVALKEIYLLQRRMTF